MFSLFRKKQPIQKEPTHDEKLSQALRGYKQETLGMVFPQGRKEASIVVNSIARLLDIDLSKCSSSQYYELLTVYSETLVRVMVTQSKHELIIHSLLEKHKNIIHSEAVATRVLDYCEHHMYDNSYELKSDSQFTPNRLTELYDKTYLLLRRKLEASGFWSDRNNDDIIPLLVVKGDYIQMCENKDREQFYIKLKPWVQSTAKYPHKDNWISEFMEFYGEVIRNDFVRGEWIIGHDTSPFTDSPILRCIVAFGDYVVNPHCFLDYKNDPYRITDFTSLVSFANVMINDVVSIIDEFCERLSEI